MSKIYPIVPLKNIIIFPGEVKTLIIGRDFSIDAVKQAQKHDSMVVFVPQKEEDSENVNVSDLFNIGILCKIRSQSNQNVQNNTEKNIMTIEIEGLCRGNVKKITKKKYFSGDFNEINENLDKKYFTNMKNSYKDIMLQILNSEKNSSFFFDPSLDISEDPVRYIFNLSLMINVYLYERRIIFNGSTDEQNIHSNADYNDLINIFEYFSLKLEVFLEKTLKQIYENMLMVLTKIKVVYDIQRELEKKLQEHAEQYQKKHIDNEKLKILNSMAGGDPYGEEIKKIKEAIKNQDIPEEARTIIEDELKKLQYIQSNSSDFGVIINYLKLLISIPWSIEKPINTDISKVKKILDSRHYGLKEVKKRIVEFIGTMISAKNKACQDILFIHGPPGVGKTSVAEAISEALEVPFIKISFAGLFDIAKLMGQMKTYVGAMPGLFINALVRAKVKNPVILIDEVDKINFGHKGSPLDALVSILDPVQNKSFRDFYVDIGVDFSKVLFILTGNSLKFLPRYILDRVEIIDIPSYGDSEKLNIAKIHLNQLLESCGLTKNDIEIDDETILKIIKDYTRESGVRQLLSIIKKICKKVNLQKLENKNKFKTKVIDSKNLKDYIEEDVIVDSRKIRTSGVSRGLAWTEYGGADLLVETSIRNGKGTCVITGNIGKVMEESVKVVLGFIKKTEKVEKNFWYTHDIEIHFPEGATPKDGPSAGIAIFVAIMSALRNKIIDNDLAMTGELSLTGNITKIGGVKEKLLAGIRGGVTKMLLPRENKVDVLKLDKEILSKLKITYVDTAADVVKALF